MLKRHLNYKGNLIPYFIVKTKTKQINLKLMPNGEFHLFVPQDASVAEVESLMNNHLRAIYNRWERVQNQKHILLPTQKLYSTGEEIRILGKLYTLRQEDSASTSVFFRNEELIIAIKPDSTPDERLAALKQFLHRQAHKVFGKILAEVYPRFAEYGFPFPHYNIREMKTRWGSCAVNKAKISLNLYLMQVPLKSIEEVVVHELCHFIQPNHSKKFYALMDKHMPDWKQHHKILNSLGSTRGW